MAKKLLAILLAVCMVVPMVLSQAFADDPANVTYTAAKRFDGDVGHGYSQHDGDHYPDKPYHLTESFLFGYDADGTGDDHGRLSWVMGNGKGYGFDLYNDTIFVANTGWGMSDNTEFLAEEDFALEEGEYYQVDWYVSATEIKGYVNGELAIDYVGEGLWSAGAYIISYPASCGYDIYDIVVVAADDSATYTAGIADWSAWGPGYSDVEVNVTVPVYEIIDWQPYADPVIAKIDAIGNVGYNEWVAFTDTDSMSYEAAAGWGPYTRVKDAPVNAPSRIEIDVQLVENKDGESLIGMFTHDGAGAFLGYNVDAGKFYILANRGYPDYDTKYAIDKAEAATDGTTALDTSKVYTIGFVFASNYVAIEFQGKEVLRSTAYSLDSGDIHFPVVNAKFNVFGYRVILLSSGAVVQEDNWGAFSSNATLGKNISCTADKFTNSGAAIAEAEAAYAALAPEAQALVSNYADLTAARTTYDAKVQAVAQTQADALDAKIATIGTVTLEDQALIAECEDDYSNMDPVVQALLSNYEVLTAARAQYNAYVAQKNGLEAKINSIGTVYYDTPTNRVEDYDNTGIRFDYRNGDGYSNQKINGSTELSFDYRMSFDFQVREVEAGNSFAQLAGGAQNFVVGYDFPTQRFVLIMEEGHGGEHNPWANLDPEDANAISVSDVYPLLPDCVYNWNLEVKGNRVTLKIDGETVVELANGTSENTCRKDGNYFILYPRGCVVDFANYVWQLYFDLGDGQGTIWRDWNETFPLNGADLANSEVTWASRGAGYGRSVVALHADAILDDGALIAECEADYAALDDYAKTIISNLDTLTAARTQYNRLADDPDVGATVALIEAIGEVTLASGDAIVAAEEAYAALTAAQQAKVTNYADLTAARTAYDALVKAATDAAAAAEVEAMIDAIGEVKYMEDAPAFAATDGIKGTFDDTIGGYSTLRVNSQTGIIFDYQWEFDFKILGYDSTNNFAQFGGGDNNWYVGYDFASKQWAIQNTGSTLGPWYNMDPADGTGYKMDICDECVHHWKLEVTTSYVKLWIDDILVVESTAMHRTDGNFFIFMPRCCTALFTNHILRLSLDLGTGAEWYHWEDSNLGNGVPRTGLEIVTCDSWNDMGAAYDKENVYSVSAVAHVHDSESAILDAVSAYEALTEDQKALVTNYADLTNAEEVYASLAQVAADTAAAGAVDALIAAIGEVTADSGDAIVAAEEAYAALTEDQKALVENYGDLLAARKAYDDLSAVEVLWGDVNDDGDVDIADAILIAQFTVDSAIEFANEDVADVNRDGDIDIADAILVAQFTVDSSIVLGVEA